MSGDRTVISDRDSPDENSGGPLRLKGRRLVVAQIAWLLIVLASIGIFIVGAFSRYQLLLIPCEDGSCAYGQLTADAMLALQNAGLSPSLNAAYDIVLGTMAAVVYCAVALVIFWRRSNEWIALLVSLWLITFGITIGEFHLAAAYSYSWLKPLVSFLGDLGGVILLALFLLIFPDGRFTPRWTRWAFLTILFVVLVENALELFLPGIYVNYAVILPALWVTIFLSGVGAQVYRYQRVSGPTERQQTKWVMFGMLVAALAVILVELASVSLPFSQPGLVDAANIFIEKTLGTLAFMVIPLTIGFSILRYRLWDIDIIINRTLVYGLLTAVLALLYFSSVVLFQQVTQALTGQRSPLAIIASTLLIAALFSPLRRRLQDLIDRRFYRRKYDAAQTLARFAQVAQEEVDLDHLTAELLSAVQQTMQPERVSLWLKEQEPRQA